MKTHNLIKRIIIGILTLFVSVIVGYLLLVLVYCIPVEPMYDHMVESCDIFEKEGTYPKMLWNYNSRLDNFSDALMLMMASFRDDDSAWKAALNGKMYLGAKPDEIFIDLFKNGHTNQYEYDYMRYWHGYQIYLKPLAYLMSLHGIRIVMILFQLLLVGILAYQSYRYDRKLLIPIAGLWIFLNPIATTMSIQINTVTTVTLITLIMVIYFCTKRDRVKTISWDILFLLDGCAIGYFCVLSYPLLAWGAPLVLWYYFNADDLKKNLLEAIELSGFWGVGFAGMWGAKWILGTLITGTDIIGDALSHVSEWSSSEMSRGRMYFEALLRNVGAAVQISVVIYVLVLIVQIIRLLKHNKYEFKTYIIYILIIIAPFVWYFVTVSHAYVHYWFAYRNMGMCVLALNLILLKMQGCGNVYN